MFYLFIYKRHRHIFIYKDIYLYTKKYIYIIKIRDIYIHMFIDLFFKQIIFGGLEYFYDDIFYFIHLIDSYHVTW